MKVYVVLEQGYDYAEVVEVFLDKELAENYIELNPNEEAELEICEKEVLENIEIKPLYYIEINYNIGGYNNGIHISYKKSNYLKSSAESINYNKLTLGSDRSLTIIRVLSENQYNNQETTSQLFSKFCFDLMSKVNYAIDIDKAPSGQVYGWFRENIESLVENLINS